MQSSSGRRYQPPRATPRTADEQMKMAFYRRDPVAFVERELGEIPSSDQAALLRAVADINNQYIIICAGRGAGKTKAVSWIVEWNQAILANFYKKYDTFILAGSKQQSDEMYRYFQADVYKTPLLYKRLTDEPRASQTLFENGRVRSLAASTKMVRGPHVECLIIDEVCEADDRIVLSALPMADTLYSRTILLSTPHKFFGEFQDFWENAEKYKYQRFGPWPLTNCPWVPQSKLDFYKAKFTKERYCYEVEGKFPTFGKLLFPRQWIEDCTAREPFGINPAFDMEVGIDWGDMQALTTLIPVQRYDKKIRIPGPDMVWENIPATKIIKDIEYFNRMNRVATAYCDSAQRGMNDFLADGSDVEVDRIRFVLDKQKMIVNLQQMLYHKEIVISPSCEELLDELRKYRLAERGKPKPPKQDRVDALMLGVFCYADEILLKGSSLADKFKLA